MTSFKKVGLMESARMLERIKEYVRDACFEQKRATDDMPDELQGTEVYREEERRWLCLEDAVKSLDDAISWIEDAT